MHVNEFIRDDDLQMRSIWERRVWERSATYNSHLIGVLAKSHN